MAVRFSSSVGKYFVHRFAPNPPLSNMMDNLRRDEFLVSNLGLKEERIYFLPTYKLKSQHYYDGTRIPSWCDRVLYYALEERTFQPLLYYAVDDSKHLYSDHRPVILTGILNARIGNVETNPRGHTYASPLITIL